MGRKFISGEYVISLDPKATEEEVKEFLEFVVNHKIFISFARVEGDNLNGWRVVK